MQPRSCGCLWIVRRLRDAAFAAHLLSSRSLGYRQSSALSRKLRHSQPIAHDCKQSVASLRLRTLNRPVLADCELKAANFADCNQF